ncbi:MAG: type II secretion system protein [Actinomycetota bacterium]|nr:type II secretion system protein [Actinomycetota bacterium]MDD5666781.1 type II secretion system protein [Actinomycetota bacterium]
MWLRRKAGKEGGFTIVEILVAGVIMVVALVPMVSMFDTSFKGIRSFEQSQKSLNCAKVALEEIQALPFFTPHTTEGDTEKWDIDDHFWGERDPVNYNPKDPVDGGVPLWQEIPEAQFYAYGEFEEFPDFRVGVQLAYLDDDLGVADMHEDWLPNGSGLDRPTNASNETLQMVLARISVYWTKSSEGESSYVLESIISDTQAIYNFGAARITVDQISTPDALLNPDRPNAAAHWPPAPDPRGVRVIVEGWGFDPDTVSAHIVRYKYPDLEIDLTYKTENRLEGFINLSTNVPGSEDPTEPDWKGRAAVGYWTLKTRQENLFSSYLFNGFIVEYPKPNIKRYGNLANMDERIGYNNETAAIVKIEGCPFINLLDYPSVRLIREDETGLILNMLTGVVTDMVVPSGSYGYTNTTCTITARFDFTVAAAGDYYLQIVNTKEPTLVGHRASDHDETNDGVADHDNVYTIYEYQPIVNDITVQGSDDPHTAYKNAGNPWTMNISGDHFNMVGSPPVEIFLCSEVTDGLPAGSWVQGSLVSVNTTEIIGTFNVEALPVGDYIVYVRNLINGVAGWSGDAPLRVDYKAGIDAFTPDAYPAFYENYYDVMATIEGYGLLGTTAVSFSNGSVTYPVDEFTVNDTYSISAKLNLIDCLNGNWTLRVEVGVEKVFTFPFSVALGPAVILPPNDAKPAIKINSSGGVGTFVSAETSTQRAYGVASAAGKNEKGVFEVEGMGFPMVGSTTLRLALPGVWFNWMNCATTWDRASKTVKIVSLSMDFPTATGLCDISVERTGSGVFDLHTGRWELVNK